MKKETKRPYQQYHFIGVGGMGMGNLALLMLAKGFRPSGSDVKESGLTRQLREKGAQIHIGHDIRNLAGADCVVYSSAITMTNPEMFHAVSQNMPLLRRAELLAQLLNKEVGITIAGAHGKTTTSSMASLLLIQAGLKPTTAIGGIVNQGDYNANLGIGRHFVAEVDESDGSFLYFSPHFSIITNIDFEHVDYYHTWDKINEAYAMFVERTVPGGVVIACGDDKNLRGIVGKSKRRSIFYGFGADNDWTATDIQCDANGSAYDCYYRGESFGRFSLSIPGKHNVLNSLAVVALGFELKIEASVIQAALKNFHGVQRRFQRKGDVSGILVVDDYGHHPTEIAATLQTAKTLDRKRVITVFQPHRYTRTKFLANEFTDCFNLTDYLLVTDIYAASEKPIQGVSAEKLVEKIGEKRPKDLFYVKKEEIVDRLLAIVQPGDLVLTLGAGDVTHVSDALVHRLKERAASFLQGIKVASRKNAASFGMVGVIMGGCSSEREISIKSGTAIVKALTEVGCRVKELDLKIEDRAAVREWIKDQKIDMGFIALHGRFGEDGGIQSVLEELEIPYNGSGPSASYAAFNKCVAQRLLEAKGILVPRTLCLAGREQFDPDKTVRTLGEFPLVVKPACEGSSIGVSFAGDPSSLAAAVAQAFDYGPEIVIQECIRGRELTIGILGKSPLPIVEIRGEHPFFDFQAKYKAQTTQYLVPAELTKETAVRVQREALRAYEALGCEGFGRVDILLDDHGEPYVLEINTIPGFTSTSLLPKAARAAGLEFPELCLTLIEMAYGKKKAESAPSLG